jgi:tetratricopeptide (TPR) repeat protein
MKRRIRDLGLFLLVAMLGGFWLMISPGNPITRYFQSKITLTDASIITGPYPLESDFPVLKAHGVEVIVSLLDSRLPHEDVLLEREKKMAESYGLQFLNFPISSILGQHLGNDYDERVRAAAEGVSKCKTKVYLHCYLGRHRIKDVQKELSEMGKRSGEYLLRKSARSEMAEMLDRAQQQFDGGRYSVVVKIIEGAPAQTQDSRMLLAWAKYRLGATAEAELLFSQVSREDPLNLDAKAGLGYCALNQDKLDKAEGLFSTVLAKLPEDINGLLGLGITRFRQGKLDEAKLLLQKVLQLKPENAEARDVLKKVKVANWED